MNENIMNTYNKCDINCDDLQKAMMTPLVKWNINQMPIFQDKFNQLSEIATIKKQTDKDKNKYKIRLPQSYTSKSAQKQFQPNKSKQYSCLSKHKTFRSTLMRSTHSYTNHDSINQVTPYKMSEQRQFYKDMQDNLNCLTKLFQEQQHVMSLKQLMKFKEKYLNEFLQQFIKFLTAKNKTQGKILTEVFNYLFNLSQSCLEKMGQIMYKKQLKSLQETTCIHKTYQERIEQYLKNIELKNKEISDRNKFMKILVSKLKQYKKQMKLMDNCIKIASEKVNQFKQGFIQAQIQCIDLMMQYRNISHQSAKMMLDRKIMLGIQRQKQFRVMQTRSKKTKKVNKVEQQSENNNLARQFFEAFEINTHNEQNIHIIVGTLIDSILDSNYDYATDKYDVFEEKLIEMEGLESLLVDRGTDMQGFKFEKYDKKVGCTPADRFIEGLTKMRGMQTTSPEKKVKVYMDQKTQCNEKQLKKLNFQKIRAYNLDFLFEGTMKSSMNRKNSVVLKGVFTQFERPEKNNRKTIYNIKQERKSEPPQLTINEQQDENQMATRKFIMEASSQGFEKRYHEKDRIINQDTSFSRNSDSEEENNQNSQIFSSIDQNSQEFSEKFQRRKAKLKRVGATYTNKNNLVSPNSHLKKIADINQAESLRNIQQQHNESYQIKINQQKNVIWDDQQQQQYKKSQRQSFDNRISSFKKKKQNKNQDKQTKNGTKMTQKALSASKGKKVQSRYMLFLQQSQKQSKQKQKQKQQQNQIKKKPSINHLSVKTDQIQNRQSFTSINMTKQNNNSNNNNSNKSATTLNLPEKKQILSPSTIIKISQTIKSQIQTLGANSNKQISKTSSTQKKINDMAKNIQGIINGIYLDLGNVEQNGSKKWKQQRKIKDIIVYCFCNVKSLYGVINGLHVQKKILVFVKDMFMLKDHSDIFRLFLFLLGIDSQGQRLDYMTTQMTQICFRILKLVIKNTRQFKIAQMQLQCNSLQKILQKIAQYLEFHHTLIPKFIQQITQKYSQTQNLNSNNNNNTVHPKNIFSLLLLVTQYIYNKSAVILSSYQPILLGIPEQIYSNRSDQQNEKTEISQLTVSKNFLIMLISLNFYVYEEEQEVIFRLGLLFDRMKRFDVIQWSSFGLFCLQNDIQDLHRLFYKVMGIFKITQSNINLKLIKNPQKMIPKLKLPTQTSQILLTICYQNKQLFNHNTFKQLPKFLHNFPQKNKYCPIRTYKYFITLIFLKYQDKLCEQILYTMIGGNLATMQQNYLKCNIW